MAPNSSAAAAVVALALLAGACVANDDDADTDGPETPIEDVPDDE